MRALLLAPLMIAVVAGSGYALIQMNGGDPHLREIVSAALTALVATALAALPLWMTRRSTQYAVAQAGLVATMLHLFIMVGAPMATMLFGRLSQSFLYWLIPLYFATLIPIVLAATRAVRLAPPEPTPKV